MILKAIKSGFKDCTNNIWNILLMALPTIAIAAMVGMLKLYNYDGHETLRAGVLVLMTFLLSVVFESFVMGLFKSDEDKSFKFINTLTAFTSGPTWLVSTLYTLISYFINLFFAIIFVVIGTILFEMNFLNLFNGNNDRNLLVTSLATIILIIAVVAFIYVMLIINYIYLGYYDVQQNEAIPEVFAGFKKSWNVLLGNTWKLLGLDVLIILLILFGPALAAALAAIVYGIFTIWLKWSIFSICVWAILTVLAIVYVFFGCIYGTVIRVKFYEEIR